MSKIFGFLGFMAPIVVGAVIGNAVALKVMPELRDQAPWFWLVTGGFGSIAGMIATRLLRRKSSAAPRAAKTEPVPGPTPPKTYEEWRKDLGRTVDEHAPDFMTLDQWRDKWRDVPRTPKKAKNAALEALVAPTKPAGGAVPNVVGCPENVIKYVQKEAESHAAVDPFWGEKVPGRMYIVVSKDGNIFHKSEAGLTEFYSETERINLDGVEWAMPPDRRIGIHVPAGSHYVHAAPVSGLPDLRGPAGPAPLTCNGHNPLRQLHGGQ